MWTSLQHMTMLTVSPCLLIYFQQADEDKSTISDQAMLRLVTVLKYISHQSSERNYRRCFPEACKRNTCSSILCQRIHSPEPDTIGFRMSHVMVVLFDGQGTRSLATIRRTHSRKKVVSALSFVTTERLLSIECNFLYKKEATKCLICPSLHGLRDFHHSISLKCQFSYVSPISVPNRL